VFYPYRGAKARLDVSHYFPIGYNEKRRDKRLAPL